MNEALTYVLVLLVTYSYSLGNLDSGDEELGEQVVTGSGLQERVKSRRHNSRNAADEEDENLKWVEENVPVLEQIEDIQIVAYVADSAVKRPTCSHSLYHAGTTSRTLCACCIKSGPSSIKCGEGEEESASGISKELFFPTIAEK